MKIKVLSKRAGEPPRSVNVENSLKNLQKHVGGYIEAVTCFINGRTFVVICNEEGRLLALPHNCNIRGIDFVGDIIICGVKFDEFADIPFEWEELKMLMPQLWEE